MDEVVRRALLQACWNLLVPVARFVLKRGMTFSEFDEIAKSVFVYVGMRDFGTEDKRANVSKVSALTGIPRGQVRRHLDAGEIDVEMGVHNMHPAAGILTRWYQDPEFLDAQGKPRALTIAGSNSEFEQLVRATNASLDATAMLDALINANALSQEVVGRVSPTQRYFVPPGQDPEIIKRFGLRLRDLGATIDYNSSHSRDRIRNFEATAYSLRLSNKNLTLFRRHVADQGARFLEQMDSWLVSHEAQAQEPSSEVTPAGVGVYLFTEAADDAKR